MSEPLRPLQYRSNQPADPPRPTCLKCGERMVQGVSISHIPLMWVEGEIIRGFWRMVTLPRGKRYEIITFRCPVCGLLENYSPPG